MNSVEQRNSSFTPLVAAISDTLLQMRAKPLVFLIVWLFLALAPQLLIMHDLKFFQQSITEGVENPFQGTRWVLWVSIIFLAALQIYLYSVLCEIIISLRRKLPPKIAQSLTGGLRRYVGLLKVVLASAFRIVALPMVIIVLGAVIGVLLDRYIFILLAYAVSMVPLLINLLRYGLAPYIHLALGITWRPALAASKSYYRTHRPVVLFLFGFVFLLPLVVQVPFIILFPELDGTTGAIGIIFGTLQSIVFFLMPGVLINFGMNNFIPDDPAAKLEQGAD